MKLAVIVWLLAGLGLALTAQLATQHLWIVAFVPIIIWAVLGVVLFGLAGFRLWRGDQRRSAGAALVALAAGAAAFLPTASLGASLTTKARFALQRGRYEQVITILRDSLPAEGHYEFEGLRYVVSLGPPLRLAFPWPGGILDNWCGAIYDPTSVVMQANNFTGEWSKWHDQVPVEVIRLFGGDLLYCKELESPFYHCCFT